VGSENIVKNILSKNIFFEKIISEIFFENISSRSIFKRKLEFQRWEAAVAAAEKAAAEIVTIEERSDVAEQPSNIYSISTICRVIPARGRSRSPTTRWGTGRIPWWTEWRCTRTAWGNLVTIKSWAI
jgi:hypothetical protein